VTKRRRSQSQRREQGLNVREGIRGFRHSTWLRFSAVLKMMGSAQLNRGGWLAEGASHLQAAEGASHLQAPRSLPFPPPPPFPFPKGRRQSGEGNMVELTSGAYSGGTWHLPPICKWLAPRPRMHEPFW